MNAIDLAKLMTHNGTLTEMRKEMLDSPPADKKKYKKVDESCKYSPLRDPVPVMNGEYCFSNYEQRYVSFMNHRFKHYLRTDLF